MRLAALLRDMPIRRKLTLIAGLSAGAALLFVALISMAQQWFLFRTELEKITYSQASIVADNSTSALLFNDPKAAEQTLEALGAVDNIEFAMLHDKQGEMFAMFVPAGQKSPSPHHPPQGEQHFFTAAYLDVFHPIILKGELVGTIHLRASLAHMYQQMAWSAAVVIAFALAGLGLTLKLVAYMHPAITEPMTKLVDLMGVVSSEKNYGLRVDFHGKDELGALAHGLNDMLAQIQMRDNALAKSREHLEHEVTQRTAELKAANMLLGKELTERKAAEFELQLVNEQLSLLLESLPVAIYRRQANEGYPVAYVTRNVINFSGYPSSAFIQETDFWIKHIHPSDAPRIPAEMANLFEKGVHEYEYRWLNADGSYRWMADSMRLIRTEGDAASYIVGTWRDITERKLAEEKIRELNEVLEEKVQERTKQLLEAQDELVRKEKLAMLGQVAGSVGHELRNPLGVMNNAVYFLQTVLSDADETTKEYLNIIKDEIAGSERIVSDLLDSVRTKPPRPEAVGVEALISQALGKCVIPSSVTIKLEIPQTLPALQVDPQQIHQVFRNLISNGVEAMPEGGTLEIRAVEKKSEGNIIISVRDTGTGIAPEVLAKLFQPLVTTKARGIGLGLVVVKNLTQANDGTVEVTSEPGRGTVFTVTLPMITAIEGITQNG